MEELKNRMRALEDRQKHLEESLIKVMTINNDLFDLLENIMKKLPEEVKQSEVERKDK